MVVALVGIRTLLGSIIISRKQKVKKKNENFCESNYSWLSSLVVFFFPSIIFLLCFVPNFYAVVLDQQQNVERSLSLCYNTFHIKEFSFLFKNWYSVDLGLLGSSSCNSRREE